MTNEEIVKQTNFCKENWFEVRVVRNWLNGKTRFIECIQESKAFESIESPWLSEVDKIQIQNCIDLWLQPRKSSWDSEYICEKP